MFLHGSLSHLFWNMLQLYIFGPTVERKLGTRGFLSFYLTCGAVGVLATGLTPWLASISPGFRESLGLSPGAPAVAGASGAVLATLVAFAMADPDQELYLIPIPIPLKARALVILIVALNLLNALGPGNRTSVATHFGGMAAGYAYIKLLPHLRKLGRSRPKDKARKGGNVEELEARRRPRSPEDALRDAVDEIFRSPDDRDRGR
jgi:membrane associated rhomboid family serine protease